MSMPKVLRKMKNLVLNRYEPHYVPESGSVRLITTTEFNIINGHDYTDAEFAEVDKDNKGEIIAALLDPAPSTLALLRLTGSMGPGRKFQGLGWQDLFAEKTSWDGDHWIGTHNIHILAKTTKMNDDCLFRLWFCPPGLVHVELDDDGTWTIGDVLSLPGGLLVG